MGDDVGPSALPPPGRRVPPLPWTGERFIPNEGGPDIFYEHAHRYAFARAVVAGKAVIDLASGEGYGAAWLADVAEEVVGIDIDPASVDHAAARYATTRNLRFAVGNIERLPLGKGCADVVTCFEAIEHVSEPRLVIEEVTRILKPGGLFLVSTPNKAEYTDEREYTNHFHVHEFYLPEFEQLLADHFTERVMLGQRLFAGSLLWSLDGQAANGSRGRGPSDILLSPAFDEDGNQGVQSMFEPMYVVAACGSAGRPDDDISLPGSSVLVDPQDLLLDTVRRNLDPTEGERVRARMAEQDVELERARDQLSAYEDRLQELDAERVAYGSERDSLLDRLAEEQAGRADLLRRLQLDEDDRFSVAAGLESERVAGLLAECDRLVAEVEGLRPAAERLAAIRRQPLVKLYLRAKRLRQPASGV